MPRRLPEKTRNATKEKSRQKRKREYDSLPLQEVPVNPGQKIEVIIDDIGSRGDGITRVQGFLVFVPEAKVGERLKILSVGRKFAIAEKIK